MLPSNEVAMTKSKEIQTNVKINQMNECGEAAAATGEKEPRDRRVLFMRKEMSAMGVTSMRA